MYPTYPTGRPGLVTVENRVTSQTRFYSFGPFCLDAHRLLLLNKDGEALPLAPRFIRTLSIFVQNQGADLSKESLMDQLWPETAVEENNLTVIISALRKTLGEDPEQHQYIVTIPGKGYRFVAQVTESAEQPVKETAVEGHTTVIIEARNQQVRLLRNCHALERGSSSVQGQ